MPLLDSTHVCEQEINSDNVMVKVVCKENHVFRPFSTKTSGATTEVTTKLVFKSVIAGVDTRLSEC